MLAESVPLTAWPAVVVTLSLLAVAGMSLIVRVKLPLPCCPLVSVTVTVTVAVPVCPAAGVIESVHFAPLALQPEEMLKPAFGNNVVFDELAVTVRLPVPEIVKLSAGTLWPMVTRAFARPVTAGATATVVVEVWLRAGVLKAKFALLASAVPAAAVAWSVTLPLALPPLAARLPRLQVTVPAVWLQLPWVALEDT